MEGIYQVPRIVVPHGLIEHAAENKDIHLKLYSINRENSAPFSPAEVDFAKETVRKRIDWSNLDTRLGMGFAILSNGFMNVNLWGGNEVYLLNQNLYALNRNELPLLPGTFLRRLNTDEEGVYCCFEGTILGHESESWARYTISREDENTRRSQYLKDFFSGKIPRN